MENWSISYRIHKIGRTSSFSQSVCILLVPNSIFSLLFLQQGECKLAARRQARAEAREIRNREIERKQREAEENADKIFDMQNTSK